MQSLPKRWRMVEYKIIFSKLAENKTKELLDLMLINPYQAPPPYEKLKGNLSGCFSRRISYQHRLVYMVDENNKEIFVLRMWTHYDKL